MPNQPYDETGALGGLFAPAFIRGNPESEAAVAQWQAENFAVTPEMIEASRGPSTTVPTSSGGLNGGLRAMPGTGTMTIPGSVDPEALRIYAQGGKYTPKPMLPPPPVAASGAVTPDANTQRNAITNALLSRGRTSNAAMMGGGDNQGFMGGGYVDPDPFRIIPGGA